jgi:hypothetical protein
MKQVVCALVVAAAASGSAGAALGCQEFDDRFKDFPIFRSWTVPPRFVQYETREQFWQKLDGRGKA